MRKIVLGGGRTFFFNALIVCFASGLVGSTFSDSYILKNNKRYLIIVRQAESDLENGSYDHAIDQFKEALSIVQGSEDTAVEVACLMKLGILYWNIGHIPEAIKYYSNAQQKAGESGHADVVDSCREVLEAISFYGAGKDYRQSNLFHRSVMSFERALGISKRLKSEEITVKCLRQLSLTYWQMNDLKRFLLRNEEALKSARKIKHKKEEGRCLNNIGLYHWKSTNYSSALNYFQKALQISREMNETQAEAECLNNIGIIYKDLGDFEKAISYFSGAFDIDERIQNRTAISYDMINIGSAYKARGNSNNKVADLYRALGYFADCLNLLDNNAEILVRISLLNNIGATYCDLGNYQKAFDYFLLGIEETNKGKLFEETFFLQK